MLSPHHKQIPFFIQGIMYSWLLLFAKALERNKITSASCDQVIFPDGHFVQSVSWHPPILTLFYSKEYYFKPDPKSPPMERTQDIEAIWSEFHERYPEKIDAGLSTLPQETMMHSMLSSHKERGPHRHYIIQANSNIKPLFVFFNLLLEIQKKTEVRKAHAKSDFGKSRRKTFDYFSEHILSSAQQKEIVWEDTDTDMIPPYTNPTDLVTQLTQSRRCPNNWTLTPKMKRGLFYKNRKQLDDEIRALEKLIPYLQKKDMIAADNIIRSIKATTLTIQYRTMQLLPSPEVTMVTACLIFKVCSMLFNLKNNRGNNRPRIGRQKIKTS